MNRYYTTPVESLEDKDFETLVDMALLEDCPDSDITSESVFSSKEKCKAVLIAKEDGILCGIRVIDILNQKTNNQYHVEKFKKDGELFRKHDKICSLSGSLLTILRIERLFLNFVQYLSGIATQSNQLATKYPGLLILDTRKTLPGYRKLAKYAVYCGGGANHRIHLSDMAMLKDNHVAMSGSMVNAVNKIRFLHPSKKVELEIDRLNQLDEALLANPDIILLDNFSLDETKIAVSKIRESQKNIQIECSGGITPEKLQALSEIGNIGVSMGYLTHTTRFLDLSLEIDN